MIFLSPRLPSRLDCVLEIPDAVFEGSGSVLSPGKVQTLVREEAAEPGGSGLHVPAGVWGSRFSH